MPPSPVLRFSPARDNRAENHKRAQSLESGLLLKEKDDDLALFNDMQNRERDNFLLQSADDFDETLSTKLRYFSDFKLGISIPVRGDSSDLLKADGDKNDYDWLLTPPDTPLFPSLDDDTPPVNLVHRGRPRSQPISISRSAKAEKSYATSRSSASPHRLSPSPRSGASTFQNSRSSASPRRLSPSPRSGNSTFQSRGRPSSSAPHSSPTPVLRSTTPSRRPSTPPNKPSSPAPRSSTPTLRRMSSGSSGHPSSSGRRGTSPAKPTRGSSASPKLQAWQSTLPGFSSDPPPNLRTSLPDRPASHTRGLSPASRNGRDSSSKFGRQSMSPTASRSASSSHSHDRDHFSSHSKGSVASSGDDDMESMQSGAVGIPESPVARRNGAFPNSKAMAFSKKPSRTLSSTSAPKRSFDSALRQMDHRKTPQNMFRPLLSSVPTTAFYVGKVNSGNRPMVSRNSSITTSSNASSELGVSVAPDTEGSDHDQDDLASEWRKAPYPSAQEEVFIFDRVDEVNEDAGYDICDGKPSNGHGSTTTEVEPGESEKLNSRPVSISIAGTASQSSHVAASTSDVIGCYEIMASCSKCGRNFCIVEGNVDICEDCAKKGDQSMAETPETNIFASQSNTIHSEMASEVNKSCRELTPGMVVPDLPEKTSNPHVLGQQERNDEQGHGCLPDSCPVQLIMEGGEEHLVYRQSVGHQAVCSGQHDSNNKDLQSKQFHAHPSLKVDGSEGAGISVLLKRSSSWKWPVVQGRTFSAINIHCDDPSYARDSMSPMKSISVQGSASASSSVDLGSSRQIEARVQRQLSSKKADMENFRDDSTVKPLSTRSSFSGISSNAHETLVQAASTSEEKLADSLKDVEFEALEGKPLVNVEQGRAFENPEAVDKLTSFTNRTILEEDKVNRTDSCQFMDTSASELSNHANNIQLEDTSSAELLNDEDCVSSGNAQGLLKNAQVIANMEVPHTTAESSAIEEGSILHGNGIDVSDVPVYGSSLILGELEDDHDSSSVSQTECASSPNSKSIVEAFQESMVSTAMERNSSGHARGINGESTITVEGPRGQRSRSFTLEEATDTILFCSSIIHDLAYEAAAIAMEKDSAPLEGSRPTVTILGKSDSNRKEPRGKTSSKRTPKPHKARQRRLDTTDVKAPSTEESNVKAQEPLAHDSMVPNKVDSTKPPKLESKCNCTVM
ncbi:uncharacterized protein LOC131246278 [Magnolia sinica]|uniref:uncharacterized protein LOC131246278 n=1 Tax=Magnolia sinica TaxID=86752 RepID=UPI002658AB82|nr:uncharacterized protein LOC131246278 [Magnolia sinica]